MIARWKSCEREGGCDLAELNPLAWKSGKRIIVEMYT
jgi:hypothetical protein